VKQLADKHEVALFGMFVEGVRIKGILEQHQDSTNAIGGLQSAIEKTNNSIEDIKGQVTHTLWSIGKPVMAALAILVLIGIGALAVSGYSLLHPDTVHTVLGR
jgi:hypothetical protein